MTFWMGSAPRARNTAAMLSLTTALTASALVGITAFGPTEAQARITRIEIKRVEQPTFQGRTFGTVGAYEKLLGRAFGEVDPKDPRNAVIVDIANAPKNARGMVEYDTDFMILKPVDLAKGNHRLWFEVNNRGSLGAFQQYNDARSDDGNNPTTAEDAGTGFIMRQGYTFVTAGWDISAPPGDGRFTIRVPVAANADGSPIVGPAMEEFVVDNDRTLAGRLTYPAGEPRQVEGAADRARALRGRARRRARRPVGIRRCHRQGHPPRAGQDAVRQGHALHLHLPGEEPAGGRASASPRCAMSVRSCATPARDDAGTANPLAGDVEPDLHLLPLAAVPHHARLPVARLQRGRSRQAGALRHRELDRRLDRHLHELPLRPAGADPPPAHRPLVSRNSRGRSPTRSCSIRSPARPTGGSRAALPATPARRSSR